MGILAIILYYCSGSNVIIESFKVEEGDKTVRTREVEVWVGLGPMLLILQTEEETEACR